MRHKRQLEIERSKKRFIP